MKKVGKIVVRIPSEREIQIEREFGAPRELVFDAHTKPDLVKRWLLGLGACKPTVHVGALDCFGASLLIRREKILKRAP